MAKVTVLIADDLKFFLEVEKSFLQRGGFDVVTAQSGREAVDLATKHGPHLILLDLEMPEMDGAAACAAMRQVPALASVPIVIMSATGSKANRERCLKAGCTEFVAKTTKPDELLGIVARILAVRQRSARRITVVFNVSGSEDGRQVIAKARDLSEGGLQLETVQPLPQGAALQMEFFLPKSHHFVKVKGEVVRAEDAGGGVHLLGVRFTDLSPTDQEQIQDELSV